VFFDGELWWFCGELVAGTWLGSASISNAKIFHFFQVYFQRHGQKTRLCKAGHIKAFAVSYLKKAEGLKGMILNLISMSRYLIS